MSDPAALRGHRHRFAIHLGTYREEELPPEATRSIEIDILPLVRTNEETARLADLIEGVAGEWSPFEEQHGISIDGVDLGTAVLPEGWRDRLIKVQNANPAIITARLHTVAAQHLPAMQRGSAWMGNRS